MNEPEVTKFGILDMQVCVPAHWKDDQILSFAEQQYPCGTSNGWTIRREGDKYLNGSPERVNCDERPEFVHVMLDA